MKIQFKTILILLITLPIFAYNQVVNVSNMSANTVQLGKANRLQIVVENSSCNSLSVSTDNGTIRKIKPCEYDYTPSKSGMAQIIVNSSSRSKSYNYLLKVEGSSSNSSSESGQVYYDEKDESINAYVSIYKGGRISKQNLQAQKGLYVKEGNSKTFDYVVEYFSYMILRDGKQIVNNLNKTATFSNAFKRDLDNTQSGDRILFYNINAIDKNSRSIFVKPIEFYII